MGINKKQNNGLYETGKRKYDFDHHEEIEIYKYPLGYRVKKEKEEELHRKGVLFQDYDTWKVYVIEKCSDWDINKLIGFSRYLEQRLRNVKPIGDFILLIIPLLLSPILSFFFDLLSEIAKGDISTASWKLKLALWVVIFIVVLLVAYEIWQAYEMIYVNRTKAHFYEDYKEVIDSLISERQQDNREKSTDKKKHSNNDSYLLIENERIEARNITADVNIELSNVSISIKQKE